MRHSDSLGFAISGSVILSLLAGCSGGGSSSTPIALTPQAATRSLSAMALGKTLLPSVLRPGIKRTSFPDRSPGFATADAAKTGAVVVSDYSAGDIFVYTTAGKLTATITGLSLPAALAADSAGNIYVANEGASDVPVYKNDYKTLLTTLDDTGGFPTGVDYDATTGIVGVTNISSSSGVGNVVMYAKGSTKPCATVGSSAFSEVFFGGFGQYGWFYVDGLSTSGTTIVGVVKGGCSATTIDTLTTTNSIAFPGGIRASTVNRIAIEDQSGAAIYSYNTPMNHSLGKPVATTALSGVADPVTFAFTQTAAHLWTADAANLAVYEFAYPAGGAAVQTITGGFAEPLGVVVTPVEKP